MAQKSLQLLRNTTVFASLTAAKTRMPSVTEQDGVAVLGRYLDASGDTKTILGIRHTMGNVTGMTFFENADEIQAKIDALQAELDRTEAAVGTDADGNHIASSSHFTSAATTVEAEIAALAAALEALNYSKEVGESEVFSKVIETEGKLSAETKNLTAVKLAGYSEGTDADIAATDTLGEALGKLQAQINAMDKAASAEDGKVVTTVTEVDGKVTETKSNVKDLQLGGYQKTNDTGDIASADTINVALSKLENQIGANEITNEDGSINVTPSASGTDINVNIKTGEHVLAKDGDAGLYTDIKLSSVTPSSEVVKEEYSLIATDGSVLGSNIKIYKDSHIKSITYITDPADPKYQNLKYEYIDASGNTQVTYVDMSELVIEAEFASGVTVTDGIAHGVVDSTSEKDSQATPQPFLTVGADGFKVSGIQDEITRKINLLDVTGDTAESGKYVAAIEEADGIVAVKSRANVSEAPLNNYTKSQEKPASTAVAATDTLNQAINKLEWQAAAATTEVVEGTDTAGVMTISSSTASDGHTVYTVDLEDVAKASAVGLDTDGTHKTTTGHYTRTATTVVGEIADLDAKLYELSGKGVTEITSANSSITPTKTALADGTQTYDLATDTSKIKLSGYSSTAYTEDVEPANGDTVNTALAKLYAVAKHHHITASSGVSATTTETGTTLRAVADYTTTGMTASYANDTNNNAVEITQNGIYVSGIWDCGEYNNVAP